MPFQGTLSVMRIPENASTTVSSNAYMLHVLGLAGYVWYMEVDDGLVCGPHALHLFRRRPATWRQTPRHRLERSHNYQKSLVESAVSKKLVALCANPWAPYHFLGWYDCDLCQPPRWHLAFHAAEGTVPMGIANLFVPGAGVLYVAPSLILHYSADHGYAPPASFCTAVLACPPMGSEDYLQAISRNGPPAFVRCRRRPERSNEWSPR